jgi:hypothetical protein
MSSSINQDEIREHIHINNERKKLRVRYRDLARSIELKGSKHRLLVHPLAICFPNVFHET